MPHLIDFEICIAFNVSTIKNCSVPEIFPTLYAEEQCQQREQIGLGSLQNF